MQENKKRKRELVVCSIDDYFNGNEEPVSGLFGANTLTDGLKHREKDLPGINGDANNLAFQIMSAIERAI